MDSQIKNLLPHLQERYGREEHELILLHLDRYLDVNLTPRQSGMWNEDVVELCLTRTLIRDRSGIRITHKRDKPGDGRDDRGGNKDSHVRTKISEAQTQQPSSNEGGQKKRSKTTHNRYSETPKNQLLKAYVRVMVNGEEAKRVLAALDTHSNCT